MNRAWRAWCMYDWANSAFSLVCMTALLPPLLAQAADAELGRPAGTSLWGWLASGSLLLGVTLALPVGAWSDGRGARKQLLKVFVGIGAVACFGIGWFLPVHWQWAGGLYLLGSVAFTTGNVLYDALLPPLAQGAALDRLSAWGYAYGYAGGALALGLALFAWRSGSAFWAFGVVGLWWAAFSLPLFLWVPEGPRAQEGTGWAVWKATWREARGQPSLRRFLLAFWLYNDGIGTVIKMAAAYGQERGIPLGHLVGALLLAQGVGIPATVALARLAQRWHPKRVILACLGVYALAAAWALRLSHVWEFWLLAGAIGCVQGAAQALSRSLYARLVPSGREGAYFALLDISGKMAGIAGPALFALATSLAGSGQGGVGVVLLFFCLGGFLLQRVPGEPGEGLGPLGGGETRGEAA